MVENSRVVLGDLKPNIKYDKGPMKSGSSLAILRTCRLVYAEASQLYYSMVELVIKPEDVVDLHDEDEIIKRNPRMLICPVFMRHSRETDYEEGIFETLGLASLLDFAAFISLERICFDAYYNFHRTDDSPSLYVSEDFHTSPHAEARLINFMKKTRTVENLVSLLATLPRLRQLDLKLIIEVDLETDLSSDQENDEVGFLDEMEFANQRAAELFMECGILNPLRKLSNVQNFDLEVQIEARQYEYKMNSIALKPKHARMAQDLKEAIEHNWTARSSIHL